MRRTIAQVVSSWDQGQSALDANLVCYSFYYFPSHLQHLVSFSLMDGFIGLNVEFKKHFLNHINEICFNILWDFQSPTPLFVQFDGPNTYWIGFSVAKEKFSEDVRRNGYWNLSLQGEMYWCEVFSSRDFKLHKNPIKEINNGAMAKVIWGDHSGAEELAETNIEDVTGFIFKKSDVVNVSELQERLTTFNSPEFKLEQKDITKEKFTEWYTNLPEEDRRKLSIEIMAKRVEDPTDLDKNFIFRLNSENQKLKTKHLQLLSENMNLTTKLKLLEQGQFSKEEEMIRLERKVNVLESDKAYLESRIDSLIEKRKSEEKQLKNDTDLAKQITKNKNLQQKYENLLQQIYSLESQIFNLNAERSYLKGLIVLGTKTENPKAFEDTLDVATAVTGELPVKKPVVQELATEVKPEIPAPPPKVYVPPVKNQGEINDILDGIMSEAEKSSKKVA